MIRVTVELIPHGDELRKSIIGTMTISNDGTGNGSISNYDYAIDTARYGLDISHSYKGKATGHYRGNNVWHLIRRVLIQAIPE